MRPTRFLLAGVGVVIAGVLVVGTAVWAQHERHEGHPPGPVDQASATQPASPMAEMCRMHMQMMSDLKGTLAEARQAAEAGDSAQAARKIGQAQDLIDKQHATMHEKMQGRMGQMMKKMGQEGVMQCPMCGKMMGQTGQVANSRCPMDGNKIYPNLLTDAKKRAYQGDTIGFCCPHCAQQWDQLSAAQKLAKAQGVAAESGHEAPAPAVGNR